jgi:hypothetical protein
MRMRSVSLTVTATVAFFAVSCGDGSDGQKQQGPQPLCAPSATFTACIDARSQTDCLAAGGDWRVDGIAQDFVCHCSTGQAGCPCTAESSPCVGSCIGDVAGGPCESLHEGTCTAVAPSFGCFCMLDLFDGPASLCLD